MLLADQKKSEVQSAAGALRAHWPEYLCEAALLGLFMISACGFAIALFHPGFPASNTIASDVLRRTLMGLAMGLTAIALVYSPMGQRSGAHMNPAVTLTFWRLGKVQGWDAAFYVVAQFVGGVAGVTVMVVIANRWVMHETVNFVATVPGSAGPVGVAIAWLGEFFIAGILMFGILLVSNRAYIARFAPLFAGSLVMLYITFEAPVSGMSMNPARTFGSAFWAHTWSTLWIYFTAPPLAMLLASRIYLSLPGIRRVYCAKLHHFNNKRCIFNCEFEHMCAADRENGKGTIMRQEQETSAATCRANGTHNAFGEMMDVSRPDSPPSSARTTKLPTQSSTLGVGTSNSRVKPSPLDVHLSQRTLFYG